MDSLGSYLILVLVGCLPSLLWLAYWIRKDCHPEPKIFVAKVLLLGIILSPLAVIAELLFVQAAARTLGMDPAALSSSPTFFLWASFVEEVVKWLAVYLVVIRSPEFDEPVDAMVYMITAALGFAAMENILVLSRFIPEGVQAAVGIWTLRFAGATLLHVLSSALLGYFIALTWFFPAYRRGLFWTGLALATVFHWTFNLFISQMHRSVSLLFSTMLLIAMAFCISALFDKIKERDSLARANVC